MAGGFGSIRGWRGALATLAIAALAACGDDDPGLVDAGNGGELCALPQELLWVSLAPDAIPALTLPDMVDAEADGALYLFDDDRVLGLVVDGEARAYPHNILWHHEIVNDRIGDAWVSVSFCPLTGSGLAFDPVVGGERLDLGVSGLLFANNLVMFDRISGGVYGPQLSVEGKCSNFRSTALDLVTLQEMSWGQWKALHPETKVVSGTTGFSRNYRFYPYGSYDVIDNPDLLFPMEIDRARPAKERVLAVRTDPDGGRGFPFEALKALGGEASTVNEMIGGVPTAVFYTTTGGEAATAFDARVGGRTLTFEAAGPKTYRDVETGSEWTLSGEAVSGELAGERLTPRAGAYVLFWFAWKHFQPDGSTFGA